MEKCNVLVCSPAYNQEGTLDEFVKRVLKTGGQNFSVHRIVIVNDASTDKTASILKRLSSRYKKITIINERINRGPSRAVLDAFMEAERIVKRDKLDENPIVVRMDSDLDHQPEWISPMVEAVVSKNHSCVVGLVDYPISDGFFDWLYNRWYGRAQGKLFAGKPFVQQSPAFFAYKFSLLKKIIPKLEEYEKRYKKVYKTEDRVGIDIAALSNVVRLGEQLDVLKFKRATPAGSRRPFKKIWMQRKEIKRHTKLAKKIVEE